MPKIHKYAASNSKDGYYIYARHNGQNVTYQVTALARRIFERLGYGDNTEITGEMLDTLHRLSLTYTNESEVEPPSSFDEDRDIQEGTPLEFVWREAEKSPRATHIREFDNGEITTYKERARGST